MCLAIAPRVQAQGPHIGHLSAASNPLVLTVDVAEDFTKFNPTFVKPSDTEPKRGSWFITEGNVYPAGTIQGAGESFDPNTAGAMGRWYCRGTHLVSASEIPAAPLWVDTAQLYFLPDDEHSIVTDGLEGSGAILRAVTGGTGQFRGYLGKQRQEFLGFTRGGLAVADAFIGCWHTKYVYNLPRPVTYIQHHIDPTWLPLLSTPNFPEYTSGHSV